MKNPPRPANKHPPARLEIVKSIELLPFISLVVLFPDEWLTANRRDEEKLHRAISDLDEAIDRLQKSDSPQAVAQYLRGVRVKIKRTLGIPNFRR